MSDSILLQALTRRQFLKTSAVAAAVVAVGDKIFGGPVSTLSHAEAAQQSTQDEWIPTSCYMCDAQCAMNAHVVNGVLVKIEGNLDSPDNHGKTCGRAQSGIMTLYNPYRVKTPMKRTNSEKGRGVDPKWQEISWDEAYTIVADRLKKVKQDDPRKLVLTAASHRTGDIRLSSYFGRTFGTPNMDVSASGAGTFCSGSTLHTIGSWYNGGFTSGPDMRYMMFTVTFGDAMYLANKGMPNSNYWYYQARERGYKSVVFDPALTPSIRKADEWVPIRPSTDAAVMLSMMNVILYELKTFDVQFVKSRTNGPYLVGLDGLYVRGKDPLVEDPARLKQKLGKPYVWDPIDQKAKAFDDKSIKDVALEGTFTVDGITCKPGFQLLKENVKDYTAEWASEISTVPADTIRRVTTQLVNEARIGSTIEINGVKFPYRPASVDSGKGSEVHIGGFDVRHSTHILNSLIGAMDVPGGFKADGVPVLTPDPADGVTTPGAAQPTAGYRSIKYPPDRLDLSELYPLVYKTGPIFWRVVNKPEDYPVEYKVDTVILPGTNAINGQANGNLVAEAMKKVPFIVSIAYNFDEPAEMADVVMPENSYLERYRVADLGHYNRGCWTTEKDKFFGDWDVLRQPVVKPVYNTKQGDDIYMELAEKLGILYGEKGLNASLTQAYSLKDPYKIDVTRKYTSKELNDMSLKSLHGDTFGLDWFSKNSFRMRRVTAASPDKYYGYTLFPNVRLPLYNEYLVWSRNQLKAEMEKTGAKYKPSNDFVLNHFRPLPKWDPEPNHQAPKEFPLWVTHYKTMMATMAMVMDNAWIGEATNTFDPYPMKAWINVETAKKLGLKDGDLVWVESQISKNKGEIKTSQCVHPEVISIGGCAGSRSVDYNPIGKEGLNINELCDFDETRMNPVVGGMENRAKVKVYKA